jgi:toxin HigB-1
MDERARTGGLVPIAGGFIDLRIVPLYIEGVIKSFQHKGIESFFKTGSKAGIQPRHEHRLRLQLGALDAAVGPDGMNFPGWKLHPLKGELAGHWAVRIDKSWRLTFAFEGQDAVLVNYQDYH